MLQHDDSDRWWDEEAFDEAQQEAVDEWEDWGRPYWRDPKNDWCGCPECTAVDPWDTWWDEDVA